MRDFTISKYKELLESISRQNFSFQTFLQFIKKPFDRAIVLRHDVDKKPRNSLFVAGIESKLGIKGTYYFRAFDLYLNEKIIIEISAMGHEIGYHYENMDTCCGNIEKAYEDFKKNLERFRKICEIETICMHGSPYSKYDNRDLWKKFDYKKLGVLGEPFFDIDFSSVLYLSDTGRRWDGRKYSIRDHVNSSINISFRRTREIIKASNNGLLPLQIMITLHPQRWTNNLFFWTKELILQNIKNQAKSLILTSKE